METNFSLRAISISRFLNRKTPPPRTVLAEFELVTTRYGNIPLALEIRRDHDRERRSRKSGKRWIAEFGTPNLYIDVELYGLHGETPAEAASEALRRITEFMIAVAGE